MCGIAGYLACSAGMISRDVLLSMANEIARRGPDDQGYWLDGSSGIGLAHRRLAIVDLSPAGHQPMESSSGRYMISFNGEIYNHKILRSSIDKECINSSWRGHSDTETLLAAIDLWGLEKALIKTVGMFAIALWDRKEKVLILCRDRFGEKPLYYGWQGFGQKKSFLFASELSAIRKHPAFNAEISRNALTLYMRHNYIGGEHSIYDGIYKLKPGHLLVVSTKSPIPKVRCWWNSFHSAYHGIHNPFNGSQEEAVVTLEQLLLHSIDQQMMADVPLGAFLSGGIDSSTIVSLMQSRSIRPIRTFSIGFYEKAYNEAVHAKSIAKYLGTEHTELYITPEEAMAVIPKLPLVYSEPFADSSQIPTLLVSHLARQHVAVSLSGDAGDELFCGYNRYKIAAGLWARIFRLPASLRLVMGYVILSIPPSIWSKLDVLFPMSNIGDKFHKGASLLGSRTMSELYASLVSHWQEESEIVIGSDRTDLSLINFDIGEHKLADVEQMMLMDLSTYLPDDILVKVDRAAMSVGLETRIPFLDHRIVEFAWSLPLNLKLNGNVTKWPIRQVLYRYVPVELVERPKMGFGVPIGHWLRGPLRDWAENLLSEDRIRSDGYLNSSPIRKAWAEHLSGSRNWEHKLWCVLMFQAWLDAQQ